MAKNTDSTQTEESNQSEEDLTSSTESDNLDNDLSTDDDSNLEEVDEKPELVVDKPTARKTKHSDEINQFLKYLSVESNSQNEDEILEIFEILKDNKSTNQASEAYINKFYNPDTHELGPLQEIKDEFNLEVNSTTDETEDFSQSENHLAMTAASVNALWTELSNHDSLSSLDIFIAEEVIYKMYEDQAAKLRQAAALETKEDVDHLIDKYHKAKSLQDQQLNGGKKKRPNTPKPTNDDLGDTSQYLEGIEDILNQIDVAKEDMATSKRLAEEKDIENLRNRTQIRLKSIETTLKNINLFRTEMIKDLKAQIADAVENQDLTNEELEIHQIMLQALNSVAAENFYSFILALQAINSNEDPLIRKANNLLLSKIISNCTPFAVVHYLPNKYKAIYEKLQNARNNIAVQEHDSTNSNDTIAKLVQKQGNLVDLRNDQNSLIESVNKSVETKSRYLKIKFNPTNLKEYSQHKKTFGIISTAYIFFKNLFNTSNKKNIPAEITTITQNAKKYLDNIEANLKLKEDSVFKEILARLQANKKSRAFAYMEEVSKLQGKANKENPYSNLFKESLSEKEFRKLFETAAAMVKSQPRLAEYIDLAKFPFWPTKDGKPMLEVGTTQKDKDIFYSRHLWTIVNNAYSPTINEFVRAIDHLDSAGHVRGINKFQLEISNAEKELATLLKELGNPIQQEYPVQIKDFIASIEIAKASLSNLIEDLDISNRLVTELELDDDSPDAIDLFSEEGEKCINYFMENDPKKFHKFLLRKINSLLSDARTVDNVNQLSETPKSIKQLANYYNLLRRFEIMHDDLYESRKAFNLDRIFRRGELTLDTQKWSYVNKAVFMLNQSKESHDSKDHQALNVLREKLKNYFNSKADNNNYSDLIKTRNVVNNILNEDCYETLLLSKLNNYISQYETPENHTPKLLTLSDITLVLEIARNSKNHSVSFNEDLQNKQTKIYAIINQAITEKLHQAITNKIPDPNFSGELLELLNFVEGNPDKFPGLQNIYSTMSTTLKNASYEQFIHIWRAIPAKMRHEQFSKYIQQAETIELLQGLLNAKSFNQYVSTLSNDPNLQVRSLLNAKNSGILKDAIEAINKKLTDALIDQINKEIGQEFVKELASQQEIFAQLCINPVITSQFNNYITDNLQNYTLIELRKIKQCIPANLAVVEQLNSRMEVLANKTIADSVKSMHLPNLQEMHNTFDTYISLLGKPVFDLTDEELAKFTNEDDEKLFIKSLSFLAKMSKEAGSNKAGADELRLAISISVEQPIQIIIKQFEENLLLLGSQLPIDSKRVQLMFSQLLMLTEASKYLCKDDFQHVQSEIQALKKDFFLLASENSKMITDILANAPASMWKKIYKMLPTTTDTKELTQSQFLRLCEHVVIQNTLNYLTSPAQHNESTMSLNEKMAFVFDKANSVKQAHIVIKDNYQDIRTKLRSKAARVSQELALGCSSLENKYSVMQTMFKASEVLTNKLERVIEAKIQLLTEAQKKVDDLNESISIYRDHLNNDTAKKDKQDIQTIQVKLDKIDPEYSKNKKFIKDLEEQIKSKILLIEKLSSTPDDSSISNDSSLLAPSSDPKNISQEAENKSTLELAKESLKKSREHLNTLVTKEALLENKHKGLKENYDYLVKLEHKYTQILDNVHDNQIRFKEAQVNTYKASCSLEDSRDIHKQLQSEMQSLDNDAPLIQSLTHLSENIINLLCETIQEDETLSDDDRIALTKEIKKLKKLSNQNEILGDANQNSVSKIVTAIDDEMLSDCSKEINSAVIEARRAIDHSLEKVVTQILHVEATDSPVYTPPTSKTSYNKLYTSLNPTQTVFEKKIGKLSDANRASLVTSMEYVTDNQLISSNINVPLLKEVLTPKPRVPKPEITLEAEVDNDTSIKKNVTPNPVTNNASVAKKNPDVKNEEHKVILSPVKKS